MSPIKPSDGMHYEGNCIRPPPEAYSILLQVTLSCFHNKCTFCGTYKDKPFRIKDDDVAMDPDHVAALTILCIPGTPFYEACERGDVSLPDERGFLTEMREMILHTTLTQGVFASNHASNYLPVRIAFPHGKQEGLRLVDAALMGEIGLKPEWMRAF